MKIGYFADGPWSHLALEKILKRNKVQVAFICVRSDSNDPVLPEMAANINVPCLKHKNINSAEFLSTLNEFKCDMYVSMSFNQIFKKEILESVSYGIINCHAGKLPFYRGRNILNWALINDEKEFGITVHHVDQGIDTGDIILQRNYPITDSDDYSTLLKVAYTGCAEILDDALNLIATDKAERIVQSTIHPVGMYCGRRAPGDEKLFWNQSSRDIFNFVRAICHPGPKATTTYKDHEVKINKVTLVEKAPIYKGTPGQILGRAGSGWLVKTLDSFVEIKEVELPEGVKLTVGERFHDR